MGQLLWVFAAADEGNVWGPAVQVRQDANVTSGGGTDLSIGSKGQGAVFAEILGGNHGGEVCERPKLSLSADLVTWNMCSPIPVSDDAPDFDAYYPQVRFTHADKLYMAWLDVKVSNIQHGILLWRQP
jgi:hypothetical protein